MLSVQILLPVCFSMLLTKQDVIECATALSSIHEVRPEYVLSVIEIESRYQVRAHNKEDPDGGAIGLMQVLHSTAKDMGFDGTKEELFLPFNNLTYGIRYLKGKLIRYRGHVGNAVAAYNAGKAYVRDGDYVNQHHVNKFRAAYRKWRRKLK